MKTPYFPCWRSRLAPLGRRTTSVRQTPLAQLQEHLRDFLPAPLLSPEEDGVNSRERVFSLRLTFECFVWQMLRPRTSCREVVRQGQALFRLHDKGPVEAGDSAYVQARQRLPKDRLEKALVATAQAAERRAEPSHSLQGRPVKVVDCSTTQLPDTHANQRRYPQPGGQKPGCGFPVMKFLVLFSLASGAVLNVVMAGWRNHDLRLFRRVWNQLKAGDIGLGDRAYGDYVTLASLPRQGVHVVARLHQKRKVTFAGLNGWPSTTACSCGSKAGNNRTSYPPGMAQLPGQITVRLLRFTVTIRGHRARRITLVTTLLDPKLYPAQELMALYCRRWRLELCLRDLKTTMGLEQLRCQSPEMAQKELLAYLVAHNLMRCVMAQAAAQHEVDLERVSFKGALDAVRQYSNAIGQARNQKLRRQLWEDLLLDLARDLVRRRPNRTEPRAVKHRPKPYPLLNQPRHRFVEISHRSDFWKGRTRNYRRLN